MSSSHHQHSRALNRSNVTACLRCRQRKQKCDLRLPRCKPCDKAGIDCVGYDAVTKKLAPRSYIHSLEERVAWLEIQLERHGIHDSDTPGAANLQENDHEEHSFQNITKRLVPDNLLAAGVHVTGERLSDHLYLGSGSGVSFTQLFLAELQRDDTTNGSSPSDQELTSNRQAYRSFEVPRNLESSPISLPERSVAAHLTTVFFELANFSFPILHEPSFCKQLELAYSHQESSNEGEIDIASQRALLFTYLVFSIALLALQKRDAASVSTSLCERYYTAALRCLDKIGLPPNVESVQSLLLIANYTYLHPSFLGTWKIVGMALRLAVEQGLHQDPEPGKFNDLVLDTRRRVFWVAYSMDRNVSWFLGRPFGLADEAIDVEFPSPEPDENITEDGIISTGLDSPGKKIFSLHYFRYRQLQSEMHCILHQRRPSAYLSIDYTAWQQDMLQRLGQWLSSTPRDMAPSYIAPPEVLHLSYYQAVIFLFKPSPFIPKLCESSGLLLAQAASRIIGLYKHLYRQNKLRLFWQAVHNLFAAGTTLLYCFGYSAEVQKKMTIQSVESSIHTCATVLWAMVERFPSAKRTRDEFDVISSKALASFRGIHNTQNQSEILDRIPGGCSSSSSGSSLDNAMGSFLVDIRIDGSPGELIDLSGRQYTELSSANLTSLPARLAVGGMADQQNFFPVVNDFEWSNTSLSDGNPTGINGNLALGNLDASMDLPWV